MRLVGRVRVLKPWGVRGFVVIPSFLDSLLYIRYRLTMIYLYFIIALLRDGDCVLEGHLSYVVSV